MNREARALTDKAVGKLCVAITQDCEREFKTAVTSYVDAVSLLLQAAKDTGLSAPVQDVIKTKCKEYLARVQVIKDHLEKGEEVPQNKIVENSPSSLLDLDEDTRDVLDTFTDLPLKLPDLDDFYGAPQCKEFLEKNVILPLRFPGQLDKVTKVKRGILLYGLPGSGKTALIGTVLSAVSCPYLCIPASALCSWVFGSEKFLRVVEAVFQWARKNQPCILCFEDLDVLCPPDDDKPDSISRQMCDEITSRLQGYAPDNQVILVGTTQKPRRLSGKLVRKFDRRFLLNLPTLDDRIAIFKQHLSSTKQELSEEDFKTVGEKTENFTGADLVVLARDCMFQPIRVLQNATHFKKVRITEDDNGEETSKEMLTPCCHDEPGAIELTWEFLNGERIVEPPITMSSVEKCLEKCAPSCSEDDMLEMAKWASEFGQE